MFYEDDGEEEEIMWKEVCREKNVAVRELMVVVTSSEYHEEEEGGRFV